jgi:hypothetical protein
MIAIIIGPIEFDIPNDLYFRSIATQFDESTANRFALCSNPLNPANDISSDRADSAITLKRLLTQSSIDDHDRYFAFRGV